MESIIALIFLGLTIYSGLMIVALVGGNIDGEYRGLFKKIMPYFQLIEYNRLYQCKNWRCGFYYRRYQSELYVSSKNSDFYTYSVVCPHCGNEDSRSYSSYSANQVKNPPKYLDTHMSCPKLKNLKEAYSIKKSIKLYKERNLVSQQQSEFERFQNATQDDPLKWLKNIQGEDKFK